MIIWKNRYVRRQSFRCCSCLLLLLLFLAACGLLAIWLVSSAHRTQAASPGTHHYVILVDQSRSIAGEPGLQTLARETAIATITSLCSSAAPDDTARVIFFGAQATTVVTATRLLDPALGFRTQTAFVNASPLGGTPIAEILLNLLDEGPPITHVVLITDGIPDTLDTQTPIGRTVYMRRVHDVATRYAQRGIALSVMLIGQPPRNKWSPTWHDAALATGGILAEIPSPADIGNAMQDLALLSPTATPISPSPVPSSTRLPAMITPDVLPAKTGTPTLAVMPPAPVISPHKSQPHQLTISLWLAGLLVLVSVVIGVGIAWRALARRTSRSQPGAPMGDHGILEICDPQTGDLQRVDLGTMGLGEVWGIGNRPECQIHLGCEAGEQEYAVLVLTQDGPLIKSRSAPMWYDDQPVKEHLLFDGDDVYLGRFVLGYQNFFRRHRLDIEDEPQGLAAPSQDEGE